LAGIGGNSILQDISLNPEPGHEWKKRDLPKPAGLAMPLNVPECVNRGTKQYGRRGTCACHEKGGNGEAPLVEAKAAGRGSESKSVDNGSWG